MPVYEYQAIDMDASAVSGTVIADTSRAARDTLRGRGLRITGIDALEERASGSMNWWSRRGSRTEVATFIREMATLLSAGIGLLSALGTLAKQHRQPFRGVIQDLADKVAAGQSLADAMERQSLWFDELSTNIVRVGENTGSLDKALLQLAEFKEKAHRLGSRITTALMYPLVVCAIGLAVCLFLLTYVVPRLLSTLEECGSGFQRVTRFFMNMSDFLFD